MIKTSQTTILLVLQRLSIRVHPITRISIFFTFGLVWVKLYVSVVIDSGYTIRVKFAFARAGLTKLASKFLFFFFLIFFFILSSVNFIDALESLLTAKSGDQSVTQRTQLVRLSLVEGSSESLDAEDA